jgi:aryl-alcohol dehydrogenase
MIRNLTGRDANFATTVTDASGSEVSARWFGQSSFATHCIATARNVVVVDPDLPLETLGPLGCGLLTGAGSVLVALDVQPGRSWTPPATPR